MTLTEVYEQTANRMTDVSVSVVSIYGTVLIHDLTGENEDIFLQDHEGDQFINEREKLWNELGDITRSTLDLALANPYVENIWN